jgi:hypothetical protein
MIMKNTVFDFYLISTQYSRFYKTEWKNGLKMNVGAKEHMFKM